MIQRTHTTIQTYAHLLHSKAHIWRTFTFPKLEAMTKVCGAWLCDGPAKSAKVSYPSDFLWNYICECASMYW